MVKVLSISQDKRNYKVVTTIGEYVLNEEVLVEFFIVKGKEFSNEEFDKILDFKDQNDYYLKALNYLSYKERSVKEMRDYLISKGLVDPSDMVQKLIDKGLINDEVYAEHFLEYAFNQLKGPKYVETELFKKGIKQSIIKELLYKYDFEREYDVLYQLFMKAAKPKSISFNKYKKQLMDKFIRSGFGLNTINEVIQNNYDHLMDQVDEDSALEKDYLKIKDLPKDKVIKKLMQKGYHYSKIKDIVNE